jgi:hypothetical protein
LQNYLKNDVKFGPKETVNFKLKRLKIVEIPEDGQRKANLLFCIYLKLVLIYKKNNVVL